LEDNYNGEVVQGQSNALGVVGLVTGILGVIFAICCYPVGIFLGIISLIFGFIAKGKNQKFAKASIILGIISIGLGILILILARVGFELLGNFDFEGWLEQQIDY